VPSLALLLAADLGHPATPEVREIASAIDAACHGDTGCVLDMAVYCEHESHWQRYPHPYSHDAKSGASRGPWQVQGAGVRLDDQAARWVQLRAWSMDHCGDLTGLASGRCGYGRALVQARADEARDLVWLAPVWGSP
jgi:hypothetical protein